MYAPLKVTTDYTLLKSLIKIPNLIAFLVHYNIKACAVVDENLSSALDFYQNAIKNNIKPIIGLSLKLNDYPLYLYAQNYGGYQNLLKLNTLKQTRDMAIIDLEKYKKNIIVIVPYGSQELYPNLQFFEHIYIGYQNLYEKSNAKLMTKNTLFVNDLRALEVEDIKYLEYLDVLRKDDKKDYSHNYYFQADYIEEKEINDFISLFSLEIPHNQRFIPQYNPKINSQNLIWALAQKGLVKRLNGHVLPEYQKRLEYELAIIQKMGFVDYFLIVYDYVLYAKRNNILVGCRGSAAGSLVSFCLGITDIDPLKYNLLFERFLNPERVTMPDIDMDFDASKREEVIRYVQEKYGHDEVALGLTYATLKSKLVLREIGKILKINQNLLEKFLKEIDGSLDLKNNLASNRVKQYLENYPELKKLYQVSLKLEGIKKNTSIHAAGVVIASCPLDEVIPIVANNDILLTGVTMDYLEALGLLKMDFLGLKNLTSIAHILEKGPHIDLNNLNLEDKNVYQLFQKAKTEGIFQFETPAMQSLLLKLKPTCFADLVAAVALGRPGPKDHVEDFIKRKNGEETVTYLHEDLKDILKETYGIMLYQEQIIAILGKIGGYSYGEADVIRRAISKKKADVLVQEEKEFVTRALKNGYSKDVANEIYQQIVKFAGYGFNKSHSVSYAMLSYKQAYLKTYYAPYFIIELLNLHGGSKNNIYLSYLKQKGYKLVKPSINNSNIDYVIQDKDVIMPLNAIKSISLELMQEIIQNKPVGGYADYFDFVFQNKDILNENILTTLIKAGTLDCFNLNQETLLKNMDPAFNYASLADINLDLVKKPTIVIYPDEAQKKDQEVELYGFYVTNHPASIYHDAKIMKLNQVNNYLFKKVNIICLIESIKEITTKKQEKMAFLSVSDETGLIDLTVFPKVYQNFNWQVKDLVKVSGEVTKRFDKISIIVNNISKLEG